MTIVRKRRRVGGLGIASPNKEQDSSIIDTDIRIYVMFKIRESDVSFVFLFLSI